MFDEFRVKSNTGNGYNLWLVLTILEKVVFSLDVLLIHPPKSLKIEIAGPKTDKNGQKM